MKKWLPLACVFVAGKALAACRAEVAARGSDVAVMSDADRREDGAQDGSTLDADPQDAQIADGNVSDRADARVDAGKTCVGLPYTIIERTPSGTATVSGDTTLAWMTQTGGMPTMASQVVRPPTNSRVCPPMTGQVVYVYVLGARAAALQVSTTNMGTPRNFDTVVYIAADCASPLEEAVCNDDDPRYATAPDRRVSSFATTTVFPPYSRFHVIVGGFYPPGDGTTTIDHGPFELTLTELPGVR